MKKLASMMIFSAALLMTSTPAWSQLAPPNKAGVSMGQVHLLVNDVDASKKFWTGLGGVAVKLGPNNMIRFPGVVIVLQKGDPVSDSTGAVYHIGFHVKSGVGLMEKIAAMGLKTKPTQGGCAASPVGVCGDVYTPEGVMVQFAQKPASTVPIEFDHIHIWAVGAGFDGGNAAAAMRAWYMKLFGGTEELYGDGSTLSKVLVLPGVSLRFFHSETPVTIGTRGTAIDHIGFEVQDLETFCKKAEANGIKFDVAAAKRPELGITEAFLTDPWGTYIELTDGLGKQLLKQ